ncbi:MAG: hypothetical protein ABI758_07115 [Candidatus Woesebacteria bacterium]
MSAEQRRQRSVSSLAHFELDPTYQKDIEPSKESRSSETNIRQFDLGFSFRGLPDLIKQFGYERGLFQSTLGVILNIWSLRQEMLGEIDTREIITIVAKEIDGRYTFKSELYGQTGDLEFMYKKSIVDSPTALQRRYTQETEQAINTFKTLTHSLQPIDFSLPSRKLTTELLSRGFHEEEINVSPSMVANLESLRSQIHSIKDLDQLLTKKPKLKVLVGPTQCLTGSPSHWSHHLGETIFVWASECVVNPQTKEIFIRQNGKFGLGEDKNLLPYLTYGQTEKQVFSSEAELMEFMNILMGENYRQPKVLLDFLVDQFGGIQKAGKIDKNIKSGNLNSKPYFEAVHTLFQFELDRMSSGQNIGIQDRLGNFSDIMKHQIARNEPKALSGLVEKYKDAVLTQPTISRTSFEKLMGSTALQLDSGFGIRIDMSLLDCVAGTPMSLMNPDSLASMQMNLGTEKVGLLQSLEARKTGISSKEELVNFCEAFGKDPSLYSVQGTCAMCGKHTFIWPREKGGCNVCPVCEVKDDLGLTGQTLADMGDLNTSSVQKDHPGYDSAGKMGITDFVAGLGNPKLYFDVFLIERLVQEYAHVEA